MDRIRRPGWRAANKDMISSRHEKTITSWKGFWVLPRKVDQQLVVGRSVTWSLKVEGRWWWAAQARNRHRAKRLARNRREGEGKFWWWLCGHLSTQDVQWPFTVVSQRRALLMFGLRHWYQLLWAPILVPVTSYHTQQWSISMVWLQNSCVTGKERISTNENIVLSMSDELLKVSAREQGLVGL